MQTEEEVDQGTIIDELSEKKYYTDQRISSIIHEDNAVPERDSHKYTEWSYFYNLLPGITDKNRRYTIFYTALYKWQILSLPQINFSPFGFRRYMHNKLKCHLKNEEEKRKKNIENEIKDCTLPEIAVATLFTIPETDTPKVKLTPLFEFQSPVSMNPLIEKAIKSPLPIAKRKTSDRKKPFGNFAANSTLKSNEKVSKSKYVETFNLNRINETVVPPKPSSPPRKSVELKDRGDTEHSSCILIEKGKITKGFIKNGTTIEYFPTPIPIATEEDEAFLEELFEIERDEKNKIIINKYNKDNFEYLNQLNVSYGVLWNDKNYDPARIKHLRRILDIQSRIYYRKRDTKLFKFTDIWIKNKKSLQRTLEHPNPKVVTWGKEIKKKILNK